MATSTRFSPPTASAQVAGRTSFWAQPIMSSAPGIAPTTIMSHPAIQMRLDMIAMSPRQVLAHRSTMIGSSAGGALGQAPALQQLSALAPFHVNGASMDRPSRMPIAISRRIMLPHKFSLSILAVPMNAERRSPTLGHGKTHAPPIRRARLPIIACARTEPQFPPMNAPAAALV